MIEKPIFLVGFMGSGKTTWGRKLANAMKLEFIDLDQEIVTEIGMSIPEYFAQFGEDKFRIKERETLIRQQGKAAIVSTGGGTPCYFDNMEWLLNHGTVFYLQHTPQSLWSRLSKSDIHKRPALKGLKGESLLHFIEEKLREREPYYKKAHVAVDQINTALADLVALVRSQRK